MVTSQKSHKGFVTLAVLGAILFMILGSSLIFEFYQVVSTAYRANRAAQSGAVAGLYAYKRSQLKLIEEAREAIEPELPIPLAQQQEIKTQAKKDAEEAARAAAYKIADDAAVRITAAYQDKTMTVDVITPYRPLFFKPSVNIFRRSSTMSFKKP